ncbi:MAG: hypothetical protein Q4E89_05950 [Eubacteriales bacterium]|nr:hypothetical protein [Eubacteriales bacterium]
MKYVKATAELVRFDNSDVITTSGATTLECIGFIYRNTTGDCPMVSIWDEGEDGPSASM